MTRFTDALKDDLLAKIVEIARWRLGDDQAQTFTRFLRAYFARVPGEDIYRISPDNLFGAAYAHWRLAEKRSPQTARVRVYNPKLEEDGWRCDHTVVEVVTDDMPFLVDSVTAELNRRDLPVQLVIHPVIRVRRDDRGVRIGLAEGRGDGDEPGADIAESLMHLEIVRQPREVTGELSEAIARILADVRRAVGDWQAMRDMLGSVIASFDNPPQGSSAEEVDEDREFLRWIYENNFTLLGYRAYDFVARDGADDGETIAAVIPGSGLGLLRESGFLVFDEFRDQAPLPPAVRAFVARPDLLMVTKSNRRSTVHRSVHMDVIVAKRANEAGQVVGEHMFVGLFTSVAYNLSARSIPLLKRKLKNIIARAGFDSREHDGRALMNIVETYPRDELFQISEDHLLTTALGILDLQQRRRVRLFLRRDDFERFVSCMVYLPLDRYNTGLRLEIQSILAKAFAGEISAHYSQVGDSPMARLQFLVRTTPGNIPDYSVDELEAAIVDATRTWSDHLHDALYAAHGEEQGQLLYERYRDAFPSGYSERFNAEQAVADVDLIDETLRSGTLGMTLYRPFGSADTDMRFKVFLQGRPIVLSLVLPMLEHLGLRVIDEVPHAVHPADAGLVMIHDFGLQTRSAVAVDLGAVRANFQETFLAVWDGRVESDLFNALVLTGGLTWREVVVIRAYCRYLRQIGIAFSQAYMEQTLIGNAELARLIVALFKALFDPAGAGDAETRAAPVRERIAAGLDQVASADQDRILRRFFNLVEATRRTNYFQSGEDGGPKSYLSFKLDSRAIDELPLPRPMFEIFVYSPRMEGIHLRGGKVSRGGIRWSDRREDFRTEVLGLMKAQMVKNAVIVPVGAKGGFVLKQAPDPGDREAYMAEGIGCYKTLIRGLLDVTDNLAVDAVLPPADVVRGDADDPYLVVAADKGTATFSDIANSLSQDYGFWLGDAFASGGSQGYDHKKMGITARGTWESVKRHFRELGIDTQTQDFTVVGIGDMAGDIFGNGMLRSEHIKLVAAFNHLHIFIDPDPDPAASFAERRRLYELPRSSWADYAPAAISKGGGVFERRAKSIALSPEIRARFGIDAARMTPAALIRVLLKSAVDLLWFGGIGTFVKGDHESNVDVGDRANDAVRINGSELRCKVIGEGANLGITQFGRLAFSRAGGNINTDFIDNSAGVDCSDHEVNIKILLDSVVADGDLTTKQRNNLLVEMTEEVGELVLRDNYLQTQAITLIAAEGAGSLDNQIRLMRTLERQGHLNRAVESLPDDEALAERSAARQGLARPEIAVLFSHCKIWLYEQLIASNLPDDRHLAEDVVRYFPTPIQGRFKDRIANHRLRREIVASSITNSLINRVGGTFVTEIFEKTGMPVVDITRAYIVARDVFSVRSVWEQIEALDNLVPASVQVTLHRDVQRLVERATLWFLRNGGSPIDITVNIAAFDTPIAGLSERIESVLPEDVNSRILHRARRYQDDGVPEDVARRVAYLIVMPSACDIVRIAAARGVPAEEVAVLYFTLGEVLGFGWLRYQAEKLPVTSYWQRLAVAAVIEELYGHQRDITTRIHDNGAGTGYEAIEAWSRAHGPVVDRSRALIAELTAAPKVDLSMLTVASRQLRTLAEV
ncbi:MAG: NAD-glutamate dehydrogenase [Rhodospirillales bacterium]|nr:NAD-glutamate dehydrogenase [Rhodospirillales bacterium]